MSHERNRERGRDWIVAAGVVLLLALYVLSIGPAHWAWYSDIVPQAAVDVPYFPILWLMKQSPYIEIAINRYIDLWLP